MWNINFAFIRVHFVEIFLASLRNEEFSNSTSPYKMGIDNNHIIESLIDNKFLFSLFSTQ